jgi:tripartite-type tricarboxylate transporter receptor subunit TctC
LSYCAAVDHRRTIALPLFVMVLAAPLVVCAQSTSTGSAYPSKALRIIVPFPPGGGTDKLARMMAARLTTTLGQPTVVDNRPGAGGVVGTEMVAKSPPDGHTMLIITAAFTMGAAMRSKLPYDPVNDLMPVTVFAIAPSMMVVHPSVPARSVKELIAFAKANPGKLNYGSSGGGAPYHIATEMFKSMAGVDIAHVPYKGAAPAVVAALSGEVSLLIANIISALPQAKSGRLRALGVTTQKRSLLAPQIPTIAEAGLPGYEFATWFGVLVPAGTPQAAIQRLYSEYRQVVNTAEFRAAVLADGADTAELTPDQFAQVIKSDIQRYAKLAKQVGMSVD